MHSTGIAGEMVDGMLTLAICAERVPRAGRGLPAPRAFIAHITPEPRGLCLLWLQLAVQFDGAA
jgi:hypothetical protein